MIFKVSLLSLIAFLKSSVILLNLLPAMTASSPNSLVLSLRPLIAGVAFCASLPASLTPAPAALADVSRVFADLAVSL